MNTSIKNLIKKYMRPAVQLAAFLLIPGMFSLSLSALLSLVSLAAGGGLTLAAVKEPVIILLATVPATVLFGRYFCGWLCSFGAAQDLAWYVSRRVFNKKDVLPSGSIDKALKNVKYAVLAALVISAALGWQLPSEMSPWAVFGRYSDITAWPGLAPMLTAGGALLLAILILSLFGRRLFCRYFCPMGAVYSLLALPRISKNSKQCKNGGDCCLCGYRCTRGGSRAGLIFTMAVLIASNAYLMTTDFDSSKITAVAPAEATGSYTDGVYTGQGTGYRGNTDVQVTVENGVISEIEILSYEDDRRYFSSAAEQVVPEIIESQSLEVDAVSGAT